MKKIFFMLFVFIIIGLNNAYSNFIIYEILPNTDDDVNMEYISIKNTSSSGNSLDGYVLSDKSGKTYVISSDYLSSGQIKKYYRTETSIILNNTNEEIYLHDDNGSLQDSYSYSSSKNNIAINTSFDNSSDQNSDSGDNNNDYYKYDSKIKSKKVVFDKPRIIIQSGLDDNNYCYQKTCKINFKYDTDNKELTCYWDFGDDFVIYGCNPEHLDFGLGKHELTLEVCDKNYPDTCKNTFFVFRNLYQATKPKAKITVQGGLTQNQMLKNNKLVCDGVDSCSLNLNGSNSLGDDLVYFWNFSDGNYYNKKDPNSIVFEKGYYEIMLEIIDSEGYMDRDFLYLDVTGKHKQINNSIQEQDIEKPKQILSNKDDELEQIKKMLLSLTTKNTTKQNNNNNYTKSNDDIIMSMDYQEVSLKIDVQGRIGSNKELFDDKLICYQDCSVNFDSSKSIGDLKNHYWDFGNNKTFEGINPGYISYDDYGKYIVKLSVLDSMNREHSKSFVVEFYSSKDIDDNMPDNTKTKTKQKQQMQIDNLDNSNNGSLSIQNNDSPKTKSLENIVQDMQGDDISDDNSKYSIFLYITIILCIGLFVFLLFIINQKYNFI